MRSLRPAALALLSAAFGLVSADARAADDAAKAKALIITGANNHKWQDTTVVLKDMLEQSGFFSVDVSEDPEAPVLSEPETLAKYKVIVLNFNRGKRWEPAREENFLNYVRNGGGLLVYHASDNAFPGWDEYDRLVGGTWRSKGTAFPQRGTFHPPYGTFQVTVVDAEHPITSGLGSSFECRDEMYTNLKLADNIRVLAQGVYEKKPQPLLFVSDYGKGRMFQTALGHDVEAMKNPRFKDTLIRGALGRRLAGRSLRPGPGMRLRLWGLRVPRVVFNPCCTARPRHGFRGRNPWHPRASLRKLRRFEPMRGT
ncbi:MAG: ThuA domain-containing protein [Isosphaeraceae bacterium]